VRKRANTFAAAPILASLFLLACSGPAAKLPHYGRVPPFHMTDSQGRAFQSQSLAGKVWVADFIYTSCPGPCPLMSSQMHKLEQRLNGDPAVRLVSISVDPQHDTPPVLNDFARHFGAPTAHWIFLTGDAATVHLLAFTTFHLGDTIGRMDHSTKFALVDKRGNIRGYYSTFDKEGMPSLLNDIAALRKVSS
jgi:protein SCO1